MTLSIQFYTLAMMAVCGAAMGACFDSYRVTAAKLRMARWIVSIIDLVYWLAAAAVIYRVLYLSNDGEVRAFVFLGLLLGIWIYFLSISFFVIRIVLWLIETITKLIRILIRCFQILIIKPLYGLYRLLMLLVGAAVALVVFLYRIVIRLLRPFWLLLLWLLRPLKRYARLPAWLARFINIVYHVWNRMFKGK